MLAVTTAAVKVGDGALTRLKSLELAKKIRLSVVRTQKMAQKAD